MDYACNDDGEIGYVGEVRQPHPARLVGLAEDDLLLLVVERPPATDTSLKRPPDPGAGDRDGDAASLEHRDRPKALIFAQQRDDLGVADISQKVRPPPFPDTCIL